MADILTFAILIVIAYLWSARGFFSAFLHMVCCIIAAAIALAVWEPAAYFIMGFDNPKTPSTAFVDLGWTLGLLVPFAATLLVIRPICDAAVRANLDFAGAANIVGGLGCGAVSGYITVGVIVLALGYLPTKAQLGLPHQPMDFEGNGSVVRKGGLLIAPDVVTAALFSMFADSTFYPDSGETFAKWRPNMADEGPLLRLTFPPPDGGARHTIRPNSKVPGEGKSFEVVSRYRVQGKDVLGDTFQAAKKAAALDVDGNPISAAKVEGVVIRFDPSAKETSGRIVVGNAQVRMIARNEAEGKSIGLQPIAIISPADGATGRYGRWRYDAPQTFIASVGGGDALPMAFEFPIPAGYEPLAIVVKGIREDLTQVNPGTAFPDIAARDAAVTGGSIAARKVTLDAANAKTIKWDPNQTEPYLRFTTSLPFGMMLQKDNLNGLEADEAGKIVGGEAKFESQDLQNRGIDRALQVRGFFEADDTAVMFVDMDERNTQIGLMTSEVQAVEDKEQPPVFIDESGQVYSPIGYIFEGSNQVWIKFTPQTPIRSIQDDPMVRISRSTPGNKLVLIYRISKGVRLKQFAIGDKVIATFKPTIEAPK